MGKDKKNDIYAIFIVFLLAIFLEYLEAFSFFEDETLSYRHLLRNYNADPEVTSPPDNIVIVYTDEAFFEEYDKFPLRRLDLSTIIARLKRMGAKVIAVDMMIDFNSAYGEDRALESALVEAGNVLMVSTAEFDQDEFVGLHKAIPRFDQASSSGYSNVSSNSLILERIVRLTMYPEVFDKVGEWPFAVQAVANDLGVGDDEISIEDHVLRIGDAIEVQLDQFNDMYIDFPLLPGGRGSGTVKLHEEIGIAASDILFVKDVEELEELAFLVEDKIVLIGEVMDVAHDEFETTVGNVFGVEIIASSIATIMREGPLQAASLGLEVLSALLVMAALIATRRISDPLPRNIVSIAVLVFFVLVAMWSYVYFGLVVSISYVLMASVIAILTIDMKFYMDEMGMKTQIRDAFGQYLSPAVVADLVKDPEKLSLGGEERDMTAFFSDIAAFSTFSENMSPSELTHVLNDYLTEMCNIIFELRGTVDKFEGDAIIAFWGAPAIQIDHAKLACFASIEMNQALVPLRVRWANEGRPAINVRMGLNSGLMVVGNLGSAQRMDYTIMGDTVNLASRLEGANKSYGSDIMISDATYRIVEDYVDVRELDIIRVVGKHEAVKVYQLLEKKGKATGPLADLVLQFERGLALYRDGNYKEAKAAFRSALEVNPGDGPSQVYVSRCDQYMLTPPAGDWDGVFSVESKG